MSVHTVREISMSKSEDSDDDGSILMASERTAMKDLMFEDGRANDASERMEQSGE